MRHAARLAAALSLSAAPLAAQGSLSDRISAVRDGVVRIAFPARPGVCGDGRGSVWTQGANGGVWWNDQQRVCVAGPVIVRIGRSESQTVSVRTSVGGSRSAGSSETDLGLVSPLEAARYLTGLARSIGGGSADDAISAAVFADGVDVSPELRSLIRDANAPLASRRQALFWFGQGDAPTLELTSLYSALEPFTLREHFVFVLSQRHDDEALDSLIDIARRDRDAEIRKRAMFWIGQSKDPKAVKFLRDLLTR